MKKGRIVLYIIIIVAFLTVLVICTNPLRWPHKWVRNYILKMTPIGTHIDDVAALIASKERWNTYSINYESGFVHPHLRDDPKWPTSTISGNSVIGEKSIRVHIGTYRAFYKLFFETYVDVLWGFNQDGELIEVFVWKSINAF